MTSPTPPTPITLQTLLGPYGGFFRLPAAGGDIGRALNREVCLLHDTVAPSHASVRPDPQRWVIRDHGSHAGTILNGVRLDPDRPSPLAHADLLRVGPWTFRVIIGDLADAGVPDADPPASSASRDAGVSPPATWRLRLLSEHLARLSAITDDETLAREALQCAIEGAGYWSGAVLRPIPSRPGTAREVSILASVRVETPTQVERRAARTVVEAAWPGIVAGVPAGGRRPISPPVLTDDTPCGVLCVPVLLNRAVLAFLYLDARGRETKVHPDAVGFVQAVAAAYALALGNQSRLDLERRHLLLSAELHAAREAQEFILPRPRGTLGIVRYAMRVRPGAFVAGDLFDALPLSDGRAAVFLGDVAGHGAGSAMLMAGTQSRLHAQLQASGDPAVAVSEVNRYLAPRITDGRFVSLWVAVFSPDGQVQWVDAGHGHWVVKPSDQPPRTPRPGEGIPLGLDPEAKYVSGRLSLAPGDRIFVYSDGLVDQRGPGAHEFGIARLLGAIRDSRGVDEDVASAFEALTRFAGPTPHTDDATAASVEFLGLTSPTVTEP
ncbi:MAG: SpoIIE family protein phosphatase [Phycisphaeraceae bacterium]|nr:MAG: SpoIIE family protein phosphatase [Phycisphaeraceae bacterium]